MKKNIAKAEDTAEPSIASLATDNMAQDCYAQFCSNEWLGFSKWARDQQINENMCIGKTNLFIHETHLYSFNFMQVEVDDYTIKITKQLYQGLNSN